MEPSHVVYSVVLLKQAPSTSVLWRMWRLCSAVKLQRCFLDCETSPVIPSA